MARQRIMTPPGAAARQHHSDKQPVARSLRDSVEPIEHVVAAGQGGSRE
jgi:hypothetical protein